MMDIKFIKENPELMKVVVKNKKIDLDIDNLLEVDKKRRLLIEKTEKLRSEQKKIAKEDIDSARKIKQEYKNLVEELRITEDSFHEKMMLVPNVYSEDTPIGLSDNDNKEISRVGEPPVFNFKVKDHIEIGKKLNLIDIETGSKVSGFRGYYLKNEAVLMSLGLTWYAINKMKEKGFSLMIAPTILKEFALYGSGHFPFGKEEVYQIANPGRISSEDKEKVYLAGTSEPSLMAYYSNSVLKKEELPIKCCSFSTCYRSEVGSYGKDTKGLYRVHEFMKVEQIILCEDSIEKSNKHLEEMRKISEEILEELKLPYRVIQICSGDMGAGKYKMYDIETWMPSRNDYGETHSDSSLTDWQTRRLNIKYQNEKGEKNFPYSLNNTVIASPRILISILENYQQEDGSVKVPDVLQKYVGKEEVR
jgi:seryl-tRNA synthetase